MKRGCEYYPFAGSISYPNCYVGIRTGGKDAEDGSNEFDSAADTFQTIIIERATVIPNSQRPSYCKQQEERSYLSQRNTQVRLSQVSSNYPCVDLRRVAGMHLAFT
jgi:hypothetical protein